MDSADSMSTEGSTQKTASEGKSHFFLSFLFLEKRKRQAIRTVYAFLRAADDAVDLGGSQAESSLKQWRAKLDQSFEGTSTDPMGKALHQAIIEFNLPRQSFLKVFDGLKMDLERRTYESIEDLFEYCDCVAGAVGRICLPIFGRNDPEGFLYALELGRGLQLTNILRDLGPDAREGRIYLPSRDRLEFQVKDQDFLAPEAGQNLTNLVQHEAGRAWACLNRARDLARQGNRSSLLAPEIMRTTYEKLLRIVEKTDSGSLQRQVRLSLPVQAWTGVSTAVSCYLGF